MSVLRQAQHDNDWGLILGLLEENRHTSQPELVEGKLEGMVKK